jgi:hypothetical protein
VRCSLSAVVVGAVALALAAQVARTTETDQFLAWTVELADSADALDTYVNEELQAVLLRVGGKKTGCEDVTKRFFRHIFPSMSHPRIRRDLLRDFEIDRFPNGDVGYFEYLRTSVYRRPAFPYIMPMARTWEINGVRLGGDKIGHMLGHGRYYYGRYLRARADGFGVEEAMEKAVRWGVGVESKILGGMVDGVFSHADLEANFQGLRVAISFCEGDAPLLAQLDGVWTQTRRLEFSSYVNPGFDESYNNSYYTTFRWKRVQPVLMDEYCQLLHDERVQRRFARYREIDPPSFSRRLIQREYEDRGRFRRHEQFVETICYGQEGMEVAKRAPSTGP